MSKTSGVATASGVLMMKDGAFVFVTDPFLSLELLGEFSDQLLTAFATVMNDGALIPVPIVSGRGEFVALFSVGFPTQEVVVHAHNGDRPLTRKMAYRDFIVLWPEDIMAKIDWGSRQYDGNYIPLTAHFVITLEQGQLKINEYSTGRLRCRRCFQLLPPDPPVSYALRMGARYCDSCAEWYATYMKDHGIEPMIRVR